MVSPGFSSKLRCGLIISLSCAFTYIVLIYMTGSLDVINGDTTVLKMVPLKVKALYNNSWVAERLWDGFVGDDQFRAPPIKPNSNLTRKEPIGTEDFNESEKQPNVEIKVADLPKQLEGKQTETKDSQTEKNELTSKPEKLNTSKVIDKVEKLQSEIKDSLKEETKTSSVSSLELNGLSFSEALTKVAAPDRTVLLTLVDLAFHGMAVNFYLTCLKPYDISNYIILTMHPDTCKILEKYGINCFFYKDMSKGDTPSKWGTQIFKDKMNVRTEFVIDALQADFSVLHSDIDMYCFKNVMKAVDCPRESCDIAPLMDASAYNAGFLFINPSKASLGVYERMTQIAKNSPKTDDQAQLNAAMNRQLKEPGGLKIKRLSAAKFMCGVTYYEYPKRYFADTAKPCPQCVVVHNNWIVSMEAKIYRAKEMHHWMYDGDNGGYYTNPDVRYLRYSNTLPGENKLHALKAALAIADILNRTLILPTFMCGKNNAPCPLNTAIRLTNFDTIFGGRYREHSFSTHPLVPDSVKSSISLLYVIASTVVSTKSPEILQKDGVKVIVPKDPDLGLTDVEILEYFNDVKESILEFHSLHGAFSSFTDKNRQKSFEGKCNDAMKGSQYRQYR